MAADATLDFLARLNDPSQWVIVRDVPVFRSHVRRNQDGSAKYQVTDGDLQLIAQNAARKEAEAGVAGVITIGHRLISPTAPETTQPRVVGYIRNVRPGVFGPQGVPCDLVDAYYKREHWDEARLYPFRSAEYYPNKREITGVALLVRDPELELGVVSYAVADEPAFSYAAGDTPVYFPELYMRQPAENYEEREMPDPTAPPTTTPPVAPPKPAGPEGVDPQFMQMFAACMKHYMANGGAAPGPMNAVVPKPATTPPAAPPPPPPVPEHAQRDGQPDAYAAIRADLEAAKRAMSGEIQKYNEQLQAERYQRQKGDCERLADQLEFEGGYLFNRGKFVNDAIPLDESGRIQLCKDVQQYSKQDPEKLSYRRVQTFAGPGEGGLQPFGASEGPTQEQYDRQLEEARMYERQGMSWNDAMAKAQGKDKLKK